MSDDKGALVHIWSDYHKAWWRANCCGYTPIRAEAGVYTLEEADRATTRDRKFVPVADPWDPLADSRRVTALIDEATAPLHRERAALIEEVSRLKGWLQKIDGGDTPTDDAETLRRWAYEGLTLGRQPEGV